VAVVAAVAWTAYGLPCVSADVIRYAKMKSP